MLKSVGSFFTPIIYYLLFYRALFDTNMPIKCKTWYNIKNTNKKNKEYILKTKRLLLSLGSVSYGQLIKRITQLTTSLIILLSYLTFYIKTITFQKIKTKLRVIMNTNIHITRRTLQKQLAHKEMHIRHLRSIHLTLEHAFLDSQYFSKKEQYLWEKILHLSTGTGSEASVYQELANLEEERLFFQQQLLIGEEELKQIRLAARFELEQLERAYIQFRNEGQK